MQAPSISAPIVSAAEPSALRAPQGAAAPDKPFNAVLQQEVAGRAQSSVQAAPARPDNGARAGTKTDKPTKASPATEPGAVSEKSQRTAADDASDIEAGIASLSLELAAMVTNLLQLHGKTTPADKVKKGVIEDAPAAANLAGNLAGATVDVGILALRPDALVSTPDATASSAKAGLPAAADLAAAAAQKGSSKDARNDQIKAADSSPSTPPLMPEAAAELQPVLASQIGDAAAPVDFTAALQAANPRPLSAAVASAAPVPSATLSPPVGSTAWDQALAQRVVWMVSGAQQSASLTLNPPELGPLQIVLNITNSQADASFIASQPEVRQALEAALPKLRDMLSAAGIELGQASVSSGASDPRGQFRQDAPQAVSARRATADTTPPQAAVQAHTGGSAGSGLIDTFA